MFLFLFLILISGGCLLYKKFDQNTPQYQSRLLLQQIGTLEQQANNLFDLFSLEIEEKISNLQEILDDDKGVGSIFQLQDSIDENSKYLKEISDVRDNYIRLKERNKHEIQECFSLVRDWYEYINSVYSYQSSLRVFLNTKNKEAEKNSKQEMKVIEIRMQEIVRRFKKKLKD
jgi:hypothetical protein